jgi:hypothetical protein
MRIVFLLVLLLWTLPAAAQSMTPMRGEVKSFTDRFAVRVFPGNPYARKMQFEINVYDQDFFPVTASATPAKVSIAGGETRSVTVVVPFEGRSSRRVRICIEGIPYVAKTTRIRTQVCGKFLARRLM